MCGISGLHSSAISSSSRSEEISAILARMTATLTPRGPDAAGQVISPPIAFGHRRLSILELSEAGAQPMRLGQDGPIITYNGEVYNYNALRHKAEGAGRTGWRGGSDTEVILHVYDQWGLEGLKKLEGIFAFALWDPPKRRLILMRDRLGVKPLFYGMSIHGLAFGSEIKAVLAAGGVDTTLDEQAFREYLWYGNAHEDRTFYRGVRALLPGHWLIIEDGRQAIGSWWRIEDWLNSPVSVNSPNEAAQRVREALDTAVLRQLVADVPVGLFLSGGLDSSSIAASAMHVESSPLQSYSAGFDFDRGVNELPKASMVANHLGLAHRELHISGNQLPDVLTTLARAHDEPFADAANIPLYLMCRELQGQIKVVLQGDGGDELFAGYRRYAMLRNHHWWRLWPSFLNPLLRRGGHLGRRLARLVETVGRGDTPERMALLLTVETLHDPPEYLLHEDRHHELAVATDPFLVYRRAAERFREYDPVQKMLLTDLTVELPFTFLTKVDRATMAAGVEARVPLLDERLVQLVIGMPSHWKVHGTEKKLILRASQRGRLPDAILDGPKTGFGVPYEFWLRTSLYDYARSLLLDRRFLDTFALNPTAVERTLEDHHALRKEKGFILWKLVQLAIWRNLPQVS